MTGPGRSHRKGITLLALARRYPSEGAAREWFEAIYWPEGRFCPQCRGTDTYACPKQTMPYRCRTCRKRFSVRTGTVLQASRLPLLKWTYAIYIEMTSLKGVSSMKLHRDLGITQKSAWFMLQRIREAFVPLAAAAFEGPVEADETYVGGKEANKHAHKKLKAGRGTVGKTAVAGLKDRGTGQIRAKVVEDTSGPTLKQFVYNHTEIGATVYTDDATAYKGMIGMEHETVKHSVGAWVNGMAHTNGLESFWATLKRAYHGVYHRMSAKHLQRYVHQFAQKHNVRDMDTLEQMQHVVAALAGRRLMYKDLIEK